MPRTFLNSVPALETVDGLTSCRDLTNPFIGQYVSLREHHLVQVPKGPTMLEEKLACPMEAAAHERRFLTAQQGSSASTFPDEHVAIIARTVEMAETKFHESRVVFLEDSYWAPSFPMSTAGYIDRQTDLKYLGDCMIDPNTSVPDRIAEFDLEDLVEADVKLPSPTETQSMLDAFRKNRIRFYLKTPDSLRVQKRVSSGKAAVKLRSKSKASDKCSIVL